MFAVSSPHYVNVGLAAESPDQGLKILPSHEDFVLLVLFLDRFLNSWWKINRFSYELENFSLVS